MNTKEINKDKAIGYTLLIIGLIMIIYAFLSVYKTFTGEAVPYPLFTFEPISLDLSMLIDGPPPANADLTQTLVQAEVINKPLNLMAYLLFMGFTSSIGYKISRVGTMLIRSVKVQVSQDEDQIKIIAK